MTKPRLEVFLKLRSLLGIYEVPNINWMHSAYSLKERMIDY
jgi:hypothetical protein